MSVVDFTIMRRDVSILGDSWALFISKTSFHTCDSDRSDEMRKRVLILLHVPDMTLVVLFHNMVVEPDIIPVPNSDI